VLESTGNRDMKGTMRIKKGLLRPSSAESIQLYRFEAPTRESRKCNHSVTHPAQLLDPPRTPVLCTDARREAYRSAHMGVLPK
jgi:hypothetical protein